MGTVSAAAAPAAHAAHAAHAASAVSAASGASSAPDAGTATVAATTAAVDAAPEVDLRVAYDSRTVGSDGVRRETHHVNRVYRRKGSVWTERELPANVRESASHGHDHGHGPQAGHAHDEAQGAPLRVTRRADGSELVEVVLARTRRVIEVDRAHHGNVGYGGSWDAVYWLIPPASLRKMEAVGAPRAGVQRYRLSQGERTLQVDWDVAGQYPRRIERSDAHGTSRDVVTATRVAGPLAAPWKASAAFDRGDYSDLLD
jgi:hypothetical protein